jgi:hypothetical protein
VKTCLAAAVAALAIAGPTSAAQLLVNGDFEALNTGFYSAYGFAANHNLWPEGMYDVTRNPAWTHSAFANMPDHSPTGDIGRMMVINGSPTADLVVWGAGALGGGTSFGLASGSTFEFSFWLAMVNPYSPANLQLWLNGEKQAGVTFAALGGPGNVGVWRQFGYSGVVGAGGLHSIALSNNNTAPYGNDFALDDMSLLATAPPPPPVVEPPPAEETPAPQDPPPQGAPEPPPIILASEPPIEPASIVSGAPEPGVWAMLITGFAAVGAMLRRRRTAAA